MSICRISRILFPISPVNLLCTSRNLAISRDSIISKLKRNVEKDILPPKPKKPLNPFLQYVMSVRSKLQKDYPDYSYQDIIKKVSEQWTQVDPATKQDLQKQFAEQHSIYKQKLIDYKNSITSDQKMLVETELMKKEHAWEKHQLKQKLVALGKPKRPLNAFNLFIQSKKVTKDPLMLSKDWMNKLSKEWKDMTMDAKNKYITEAAKLTENYKIDMKKWEENMIQAGHRDLLKSSVKSKRDCSNMRNMRNIKIQTKESDKKQGWGTDHAISHRIPNKISDSNNGQPYESTKSLVLNDNGKNVQHLIKYPRDTAKDASKNYVVKSESSQVRNIYTRMYEYFIPLWNRFSTILTKSSRDWKMKSVYSYKWTRTGDISRRN